VVLPTYDSHVRFQIPGQYSKVTCFSGNITWSNEAKILAVQNLRDGVDIYRLTEGKLVLSHHLPMIEQFRTVKHVDFTCGGSILFSGSDFGKIQKWRLPECEELETLSHGSCEFARSSIDIF